MTTNKILQFLGYNYKRETDSHVNRDFKPQQLSNFSYNQTPILFFPQLQKNGYPLSWITLLILMSVHMKRGGKVRRHEEQIVQSLTVITSIILFINIYIKKVPNVSPCFCASFHNRVLYFICRWLELLRPIPETRKRVCVCDQISPHPTQFSFNPHIYYLDQSYCTHIMTLPV